MRHPSEGPHANIRPNFGCEVDPEGLVLAIRDAASELAKTGYRDLCIDTLSSLQSELSGIVAQKSKYRAKQDGDWERIRERLDKANNYSDLIGEWYRTAEERMVLPIEWQDLLREDYKLKLSILRTNNAGS